MAGLSPRGRGNRSSLARSRWCSDGSIPAWAGEPSMPGMCSYRIGSIPAWAGEPYATRRPGSESPLHGLSPRGRGNHDDAVIPAMVLRVYPRVGGGTAASASAQCKPISIGLSPRGRGNLLQLLDRGWPLGLSPRGRGNLSDYRTPATGSPVEGSIPAWAGEPAR